MKMKVVFNKDFPMRLHTSLLLVSSVAVLSLAACSEDVPTTSDVQTSAGTSGSAGSGTAGSGAAGSGTAGSSTAGAAGGSGAAGGGAGGTAGGAGTSGSAGSATAGSSGAGGGDAKPQVLALSMTGHDRLLGVTFDAAGNAYAVGNISDTTETTADFGTIVAKFGPDGQLDKTFGTDGVARHNLVVGTSGEATRGIAVQPDGKIVIAATVEHAGGDPKDRDVAVARLLPTGALDTAFGTMGIQVHDLSTGEALADGTFTADQAWGVAITADGKILVSGAKKSATGSDRDHAMLRLTSTGALDTSFATGGVFSIDVASQNADPRGLLLLADGSVLGSGYTKSAAGVVSPVIFKLTPAGALDASFGKGGLFNETILPHTTECYGVALQGEKLVTQGYGKSAEADTLDWVSLRVDKDGKLDTTYGTSGHVMVDAAGFNDNGRGVVVLPDGRVLLLGSARSDASTSDAMVALLTKDGAPDTSFGPKGTKVYDLGGTGDQFWSGALSPDGKRVALVGVKGSTTTNDDAAAFFLSVP